MSTPDLRHRFRVDPIAATNGAMDWCGCGQHRSAPVHDRPCPECGVPIGQPHDEGCDIAICLATGVQRIQCEGEIHEYKGRSYGEHDGTCGRDVWTGAWPGELDCARFGWWCTHPMHPPVHPCDAYTPGATTDLNRLARDAKWDPVTQRFEKR